MTSFIDAIENAAYQKALKNLKIMDKYIYRGKLERVVDGDTIDALIDVGFDIWVKKRIRYKQKVLKLKLEIKNY